MSFRVATQTLSQAWQDAQNLSISLESIAQAQKDLSLAGPVVGSVILDFEKQLRSFRDRFDVIAALSGIAAYVAAQPDTPAGYDVAAQFSAMRTQIVATITWIRNNFPRDSTNTYMLERSWGADGPVERTFTTAQLAPYRTQLDALLASIG
jgi:hypothetical protein